MIKGLILVLTQHTAMAVTQDYITHMAHSAGSSVNTIQDLTQLTHTTPCANSTQHSIIIHYS